MKPQANITTITSGGKQQFIIHMEDNGVGREVAERFDDYQQALDFILKQGWQLKRETPSTSLHVETRFLKP